MTIIKDGYIGWREAVTLTVTFIATKILLAFPLMMVKLGLTGGWLIPVIATVLGLLGFGLISVLMQRFPGQSIVEVSEIVAGKYFGTIIALGFFGFFFFIAVVVLRQFAETVIATTLPQTPISIVTALFLAAVLYTVYMGIESIARGNWLLFPFMLGGYLTILAGVLPHFNTDNLFPVLGSGAATIIKFGMLKSSIMGDVLVLAVLYPYIREQEKFTRIGVISLAVAGSAMTLAVLVLIGTFTAWEAKEGAVYPMFQLARLIVFGRFVQRIEAIFLFVWIFAGLIQISVSLYAAAIILARILKLPVYRPLIFSLALLVFSLSFLPPNYITAIRLETEILRNYGWIIAFALPGLLLVLARLRGLGNKHLQGTAEDAGEGAVKRRTANAGQKPPPA